MFSDTFYSSKVDILFYSCLDLRKELQYIEKKKMGCSYFMFL